ncbi:MAG: glutamate synthase large subunit [Halodesulfurarchaeum sp.]
MCGIDEADCGMLADPAAGRDNCGVGAVMNLSGDRNHDVLSEGLTILENLEHRGTTGAEPKTGDGAGVMIQIPHAFFEDEVGDLPSLYAVGALFMPQDPDVRKSIRTDIEGALAEYGLTVEAWRDVPTNNDDLGATALESEPHVTQCFVSPTPDLQKSEFDRRLYVSRRAIEKEIDDDRCYVVSLDRQTVVYKGLLKGSQVAAYYPDLTDDRVRTNLALVHARFSTNTLGAWHLAHPYRNMIHNGEFNTIQGNVNWMRAREADLAGSTFTDAEMETILPVIGDPEQSDTASIDNALDLLLHAGRDLPHALRMLIPEAWREDDQMNEDRRNWYEYHASLVEPWDGPALVLATDGKRLGAVLDRNGLRPCRYEITTGDRLVMASEQGAIEHNASTVRERGRLQPGELFLADPEEGRVIPDEEVFEDLSAPRYEEWVETHQRRPKPVGTPMNPIEDMEALQATFGYTHDEFDELLKPMVEAGKDPIGSMGDDTPLAALSDFDKPVFDYFRQLFAQVTNPPIDYIRERLITSLEVRLGRQRNLLAETPEHARQIVLDSPILTDADLAGIKATDRSYAEIDMTFGSDGDLKSALDRIRKRAESAVEKGAEILVVSDRNTGPERLPIPSLLATGAVHHHLVREGLRARVGLVVESGDPRTTHHVATLIGYGAGAVNPYLGLQTITDLVGEPESLDAETVISAYVGALENGLLKIMAKMGISTVESYRGAQIFEALGLDSDVVEEYFTGTPTKIDGIGLETIESDLRKRHERGFHAPDRELARQGEFQNRSDGRHHAWNPSTVQTLQTAVREGDYEMFKEFSDLVEERNGEVYALRGLLEFATDERESIPLEAVEPVEDIVGRFSTAAMSLGSLSPEAHENNAIAMNRLGGAANTGEGGEPVERFGTERECSIKQVASGRFGVTTSYLTAADDLQIKMAQGSKPGEGGHLPGEKVNEMIATVRSATPGVPLISPPPQHDIYSIEDIKQLITDLRTVNPEADIHVKLVSEDGIGTVAAGVAKAKADSIHVSGHSGGTGASPKTSIKHAGLPWELGLAEANQVLRSTGLRSRVTLRVDGGLKTGRDVAVAALLGAEEFAFGTASLVSEGCVMARICHTNNCPTGVATQDEALRKRFRGTPEQVINYFTYIARELREIMADLGIRTVDELVGRVDLLGQQVIDHPRASALNLAPMLQRPPGDETHKTREQLTPDVDEHFDRRLIDVAEPALNHGEPVHMERSIRNVHRTVGGMLSGRVVEKHGNEGLPPNTISADFTGTAGQSFGAFLAPGVSFDLYGPANDYVGKGMSGGDVAIHTSPAVNFDAADTVLIGNVALYGATGGELYVNGSAGERFAVRNSGALAVVEGVGDHGCEYMTGGVVVVLGQTGRNFAAGMSGGIAYVYDPAGDLRTRANTEMVTLSRDLDRLDRKTLRHLVETHATRTDSNRATEILENWATAVTDFVKVVPEEYARAIAERPEVDVRRTVTEEMATVESP